MLILSGLFRKCVIADSCAQLANAAFDGRMGRGGWVTLLGAYAFAFQIYGDFSGYSDIARGSAQLLGFHFMVNFRQPYLATSLQDFWRRWHISLSTWLRDYLYIPLGGNRLSGRERTSISCSPCLSAASGTARTGTSFSGAGCTEASWRPRGGSAFVPQFATRSMGQTPRRLPSRLFRMDILPRTHPPRFLFDACRHGRLALEP